MSLQINLERVAMNAKYKLILPGLLYAGISLLCLLLGVALIRWLSLQVEQKVFSLILFCALQLWPLRFATRLNRPAIAAIHLLAVSSYFLVASLANLFFNDWKVVLPGMFYGYCSLLLLLAGLAIWSAHTHSSVQQV